MIYSVGCVTSAAPSVISVVNGLVYSFLPSFITLTFYSLFLLQCVSPCSLLLTVQSFSVHLDLHYETHTVLVLLLRSCFRTSIEIHLVIHLCVWHSWPPSIYCIRSAANNCFHYPQMPENSCLIFPGSWWRVQVSDNCQLATSSIRGLLCNLLFIRKNIKIHWFQLKCSAEFCSDVFPQSTTVFSCSDNCSVLFNCSVKNRFLSPF